MTLLVLLTVLGGIGLLVVGMIMKRRDEDAAIADVLGMAPPSFGEEREEREETLSAVTGRAVDLAGQAVDAMDKKRALGVLLDRAQIPLRPGEFVIVMIAAS